MLVFSPRKKFSTINLVLLTSILLCLQACGILGIHFSLHNPKNPGHYASPTAVQQQIGPLNKYRSCYDVNYYALEIKINAQKQTIEGRVRISATALKNLDTLQVDLYQNMELIDVQLNDSPAAFLRKSNAIMIYNLENTHAKKAFKLTIHYRGKPMKAANPPWSGGFVWKKDKEKNPWLGVACESEGASLWWPNKDHNSDEADSVSVKLIVPEGLTGVSNGVLRKKTTHHGWTTFDWFVSYPINNYNITLYVGKFDLVTDTYNSQSGKSIALNYYVLPGNREKAKMHFEQVKEQLNFYEKSFGNYPWQRDGYKLVESPYAGMEHQSAIAYGNGYKNNHLGFDYIILHETAHEWWGNSVTAYDLADAWIHEGFATFSEALFVENKFGHEAYLNYLMLYRITISNKRPVIGPFERRYFNYKDGDIYVKGAWILHTLRSVINDDSLFFQLLKTFSEENKYRTVNSQDFIQLTNKLTRRDFGWFFNQYLYNRYSPILEYNYKENNLFCKWTNVNDDFQMPIDILIDGSKMRINPGTSVKKFPVAKGSIQFPIAEMLMGIRANEKLND